jgi:hypothetical protein
MRRVIVYVALALVMAVPARAQVLSYIDTPAPPEQDVPTPTDKHGFYLDGWAFDCSKGGQQPTSVTVYLTSRDGQYELAHGGVTKPRFLRMEPTPRPDVQQHFAPFCAGMNGWTGFYLYVYIPADYPSGEATVTLEWVNRNAYGVTARSIQERVINIQDAHEYRIDRPRP